MSERSDSPSSLSPDDDCPLPPAAQRCNMLCFGGIWALYYLAAPVVYVGITHANLVKGLGGTTEQANFPGACYNWMTALPILVAWFFPNPRLLKRLIVISISMIAFASAIVPLGILFKVPASWTIGMVILHGAILGGANGVALTTMWEMVRRGISTSRRGGMMALAFGVGPLMACVGAMGQQALLDVIPWIGVGWKLPFPQGYLILYAAAVPILIICAVLAATFRLPTLAEEGAASPVRSTAAGVAAFFTNRALLAGAVGYLLVYSGGNAIFANVSLYAKDVVSEIKDSQGIQQFLRFGFKAAAGGLLGFLLSKTNPRAPLIATTLILMSGLVWVLNVSGPYYLISAGILGAGELFGAYFPNYIAAASRKDHVRSNIALLNVLASLVGFSSILFGKIADRKVDVGAAVTGGAIPAALLQKVADHDGLRASFFAAEGVLIAALLLILFVVPRRPVPESEERPA